MLEIKEFYAIEDPDITPAYSFETKTIRDSVFWLFEPKRDLKNMYKKRKGSKKDFLMDWNEKFEKQEELLLVLLNEIKVFIQNNPDKTADNVLDSLSFNWDEFSLFQKIKLQKKLELYMEKLNLVSDVFKYNLSTKEILDRVWAFETRHIQLNWKVRLKRVLANFVFYFSDSNDFYNYKNTIDDGVQSREDTKKYNKACFFNLSKIEELDWTVIFINWEKEKDVDDLSLFHEIMHQFNKYLCPEYDETDLKGLIEWKDELIALMRSKAGLSSVLNSLTRKGGSYDYFIKNNSNEKYNELWDKYEPEIIKSIITAFCIKNKKKKYCLERLSIRPMKKWHRMLDDWDKEKIEQAVLKIYDLKSKWINIIFKDINELFYFDINHINQDLLDVLKKTTDYINANEIYESEYYYS